MLTLLEEFENEILKNEKNFIWINTLIIL
jgi:hypothetical protein